MEKIFLEQLERTYKNNGQHAEQLLRYTLTHTVCKADNREGADLWDIQIKSSRATVCKGTDTDTYITNDVANRYAYVTADFTTAYIMDKETYKTFVKLFSTVTTESKKNGGAIKTRLKEENKAMLNFLEGKI